MTSLANIVQGVMMAMIRLLLLVVLIIACFGRFDLAVAFAHEDVVPVGKGQPQQHGATAAATTEIPDELCSPYGSYPNPLGVTDEDRAQFHPVVKYPLIWQEINTSENTIRHRILIPNVAIRDHTRPSEKTQLATEEERIQRQEEIKSTPWWRRKIQKTRKQLAQLVLRRKYDEIMGSIGRYDENRVAMYTSELFQDTDNKVDGYAGARTVHVGIDLSGSVGAKVYAFTHGIIHSVGYNSDLGDYGHVIVVEHMVPSNGEKMWALYGHLDETSTKGKVAGQQIKKGQVLGRLGDIHENGGW